MKTTVLHVDPDDPEINIIRLAADRIRNGGLVAFPTETVYGLGANALNVDAIGKLFQAKKRPSDNPPIVHVENIRDVRRLVRDVSARALKLMKTFWPGPLTLVFERSETVPNITTCNLSTIAIRMPKHNVALALIRESGCPIAAPSANLAGKPSSTTAEHVLDDLDERIDVVLDAGPTSIGVESTVLDVVNNQSRILRPGATTYELLKEAIGTVKLHSNVVSEKEEFIEEPSSPGMKHKHYAPDAEMIVVEGEFSAVMRKVKGLIHLYRSKGCRVGVLATDETVSHYQSDVVKTLGTRDDLKIIAKNLFRLLREFDQEEVDVVLAESVPTRELGLAIMNRLRKASGYRIIKAR